ncbi:hypothetical protein AB3X52_00635 [Nocardioides sp. DS6]|uniref:Thioredoxin n=1 Tax=Nocardioides eburneus TaxID=3231482 RepID=A0ABV3SVM1_9ACTN
MTGPRRLGADTPEELGIVQAAVEYAYDQDWSDGLPVVPATRERTDAFLATTDRHPDEVIGRLEPLRREVTVETAAVNAVMAGCRPEYFPVVLAAWDALMLDPTTAVGAWQSTSGPAPLIVVNGPVRERLALNGGGGALGPGFRANATIARAIGLLVRNGLGVRPQVFEQATQGIPGRWGMCLAENEEESPWEPIAVDGGLAPGSDAVSAMLVRDTEFVDNRHTADPEKLLADLADTLGRTGALIFEHAAAGLVLCPEHAQLLARAGMAKEDVRRWLADHTRRSVADLRAVGKNGLTDLGGRGVRVDRPDEERSGEDRVFATDTAQHLPILVAGARNAGISSVVRLFTSWPRISARVESCPADVPVPLSLVDPEVEA